MVYYAVILISFILLTSGCAHQQVKGATHQPVQMEDIYRQSLGDAKEDVGKYVADYFKEKKIFGYVKPYEPLIKPPVVKKVWVPDHRSEEDTGVLISGHWVYLMIEGPKWFVGDEVKQSISKVLVPGKETITEINDHKGLNSEIAISN